MNTSGKTFKKLLKYTGIYKYLLLLTLILSLVISFLSLYIPMLFGDAIDLISGKDYVDIKGIVSLLIRIMVFAGVTALSQWLMNIINNKISYHLVKDLRNKAFSHIENLPLRYLDKKNTGELLSRVITDSETLSEGLLLGLYSFFTGIITILITLIFMFSKNVPVTVLVVLLTPLSFILARFIAKKTFKMFKRQNELRGIQTAFTEEIVGNQKLVKALGYEENVKERFEAINKDLTDAGLKAVFFSSITNPSTRFVNSVIYAAVAFAGAWMCISGSLTIGGLSVMLYYANQYTKPFNDISSVVTEFQNSLAASARIFELLEQEPEKETGNEELPYCTGDVEIDKVSFSYDKSKPLIKDLHLKASPGDRIAIVGPTGCGKTTIINLLMRFYDPDAGTIRMDGKDIYSCSRSSLRKNYGMVLQDIWIRNATVRDNITLGRDDIKDENILEAAKAARSYDLIKRLPLGLDTVLTENSLSQGENQLLCITRVMVLRPPLLILDEATSNIDTMTEKKIREAFLKLMEGRTSFIVAHRLSTITDSDLILVMKDGSIIEQGTHKELLAKNGFYRELYLSQF